VSGPRFPIDLRGATTAYVASANTDAAMRGVRPGRHILDVRGPSASADDESSHGFASELPPATSHGFAEWHFSSVPDPVMFRRFLDATDYWFGYSDNSSTESYDPARQKLAMERFPRPGNWTAPGCGAKRSSLLTAEGGRHQRATGSSTRA
jgi:hypothetical protein